MSESVPDSTEMDEFEAYLQANRAKSKDELEVERAFPNLPPWILQEYSASEWLWFSDEEKRDLIQSGGFRGGRAGTLDIWSEIGG